MNKDPRPMEIFIILISVVTIFSSPSYAYDSLDPNGNITLTWDVILQTAKIHDITVTIRNNQVFRHVERPGWKVSWRWRGNEVIWSMWGAEATEQGNCWRARGEEEMPHTCEKRPVIVDLMPGALYNKQTSHCCKGGRLSSLAQDPESHVSSFRMVVAGFTANGSALNMPTRFGLGLRGYSCGNPFLAPPTRFTHHGSRRHTQALETWKVVCVYSEFRGSTAPNCCVSLSAFYSRDIVPCPKCSCKCQPPPNCAKSVDRRKLSSGMVRCSQHLCPVQVHWHVKQSYREFWRVKITIANLNFAANYSDWNLVVLHPNLSRLTRVFSFSYHSLNPYGAATNDTGVFWGIKHYNEMLMASGNVQTEMLLHKDSGVFTFEHGWAFPRKISFNGDHCVMPPPNEFPRLPLRS